MNDPKQLVDRYVAIWNEGDAERRRQGLAELWSEDAVHVLQPPEQVQEAAANLAVTPTFQVRGHAELEGGSRGHMKSSSPREATLSGPGTTGPGLATSSSSGGRWSPTPARSPA
jgi:hypothetical protein